MEGKRGKGRQNVVIFGIGRQIISIKLLPVQCLLTIFKRSCQIFPH